MSATNVMFAIKVGAGSGASRGSARDILATAIWEWMETEFEDADPDWAMDLADHLIDELKPGHSGVSS